jgi:chemotaxis signal transduction protein
MTQLVTFQAAEELFAVDIFAVDAVHEVVTLPDAAVEEPPAIYRGLAREYLKGVARHGDRLFVVLDAARLLTSSERIEMERALQTETRNG